MCTSRCIIPSAITQVSGYSVILTFPPPSRQGYLIQYLDTHVIMKVNKPLLGALLLKHNLALLNRKEPQGLLTIPVLYINLGNL